MLYSTSHWSQPSRWKSQHKLCWVWILFKFVTDAKFEPSKVTFLWLMPRTGLAHWRDYWSPPLALHPKIVTVKFKRLAICQWTGKGNHTWAITLSRSPSKRPRWTSLWHARCSAGLSTCPAPAVSRQKWWAGWRRYLPGDAANTAGPVLATRPADIFFNILESDILKLNQGTMPWFESKNVDLSMILWQDSGIHVVNAVALYLVYANICHCMDRIWTYNSFAGSCIFKTSLSMLIC